MSTREWVAVVVVMLLIVLVSILSSCEAERRGCLVEVSTGCAP